MQKLGCTPPLAKNLFCGYLVKSTTPQILGLTTTATIASSSSNFLSDMAASYILGLW